MLKIIISGPFGSGKSTVAGVIISALRKAGAELDTSKVELLDGLPQSLGGFKIAIEEEQTHRKEIKRNAT